VAAAVVAAAAAPPAVAGVAVRTQERNPDATTVSHAHARTSRVQASPARPRRSPRRARSWTRSWTRTR
jgi:hypothetical protein